MKKELDFKNHLNLYSTSWFMYHARPFIQPHDGIQQPCTLRFFEGKFPVQLAHHQ